MKVVHLNTNSGGGAAIAAIRLHKGLLRAGIDSRMLFLHNHLQGKEYAAYAGTAPTLPRWVFRKLGGYTTVEDKNRLKISGKPQDYEIVSFPVTSYQVEQHPWLQEADIIHLHWVSGFINYPVFFSNNNKPLVWTLHDMNPFQGIFHYAEDRSLNEKYLGKIEQEMADVKYDALSRLKSSLIIVTPSAWLGALSSASRIFRSFDHKVIPNGLDTTVFKPADKAFARRVFDLPEDKVLLLFISERISTRRKGFDLLLQAMDKLNEDNIAVCTAGISNGALLENVYNIGPVNDERLMALLYAAADAFVLPSREDNLPNVMLEAIACGTPVIAFATGGINETIWNAVNGILAETISAEALAAAIKKFIRERAVFDPARISRAAQEKYDLAVQAAAYIDLYQQLAAH